MATLAKYQVIHDFKEHAAALYEGRWIPLEGWRGIVQDLPERRNSLLLVTVREDKGKTFVFAETADPRAVELRPGDKVTIRGRIREVRFNGFIYLAESTIEKE